MRIFLLVAGKISVFLVIVVILFVFHLSVYITVFVLNLLSSTLDVYIT